MLVANAENSFRQGIQAMRTRRTVEALALFEAAIEIERRAGVRSIQPRYLSHYGLLLAVEARRCHEGIYFCREATAREHYNPDLFLNLSRACLAAGRRREAVEALDSGLRLQPEHAGLRALGTRMGRRKSPVIPFLSRNNPLNVFLGRLRSPSVEARGKEKRDKTGTPGAARAAGAAGAMTSAAKTVDAAKAESTSEAPAIAS